MIAYRKGQDANREGQMISACPYPGWMWEALEWRRGWLDENYDMRGR